MSSATADHDAESRRGRAFGPLPSRARKFCRGYVALPKRCFAFRDRNHSLTLVVTGYGLFFSSLMTQVQSLEMRPAIRIPSAMRPSIG